MSEAIRLDASVRQLLDNPNTEITVKLTKNLGWLTLGED